MHSRDVAGTHIYSMGNNAEKEDNLVGRFSDEHTLLNVCNEYE